MVSVSKMALNFELFKNVMISVPEVVLNLNGFE